MEIKIIEESKNKIIVEVQGEDATLCNALRKELMNDEAVKTAAYAKKHPMIGSPYIIVETSGKNPRDALLEAAKRLKKEIEKFRKDFDKEA